jgi:hypothetical protein
MRVSDKVSVWFWGTDPNNTMGNPPPPTGYTVELRGLEYHDEPLPAVWDGTDWVPFSSRGAKAWNGTEWVPELVWDGARWVGEQPHRGTPLEWTFDADNQGWFYDNAGGEWDPNDVAGTTTAATWNSGGYVSIQASDQGAADANGIGHVIGPVTLKAGTYHLVVEAALAPGFNFGTGGATRWLLGAYTGPTAADAQGGNGPILGSSPDAADGWSGTDTRVMGEWVTLDTSTPGLDTNLPSALVIPDDGTYALYLTAVHFAVGSGPGAVSGEVRFNRVALLDGDGNVVTA